MFRLGHYGMAMIVYAVVALVLLARGYREDAVFGVFVMLLFTMHPDFDGDFSFIPHREITHTVWFAALVGLLCALIVIAEEAYRHRALSPAKKPGAWAFSLGTLSVTTHLLADMLNPWGVMPFYPVSNVLITFDVVYASNDAANYALLLAGLLALAASWHAGHLLGPEEMGSERGPITAIKHRYRRIVGTDADG